MPALLAITTIARSGGELFHQSLALHPEILMLPGQNFSSFDGVLYRAHNYQDYSAKEVFDSLRSHCYTREANRIWSGLTKGMSSEERRRYLDSEHLRMFGEEWPGPMADFQENIACFAKTYFAAMGQPLADARYVGVFTNNWALSVLPQSVSRFGTRIVHVGASAGLWAAIITESWTYNPVKAMKFWICGSLAQRAFENELVGRVVKASADYFLADQGRAIGDVLAALDLPSEYKERPLGAGFSPVDYGRWRAMADLASMQATILRGADTFVLAEQFEQWADEFLADEAGVKLVGRYRAYWNSTAHYGFDVVGPLESEIVDRALQLTGARGDRNWSFRFFFELVSMTSRSFSTPTVHTDMGLGCLEDDLVLPVSPYYLRAAIAYLEKVLSSQDYDPWTYQPLAKSSLYRRLEDLTQKGVLAKLGLGSIWQDLHAHAERVAGLVSTSQASDRRADRDR